MYVQTSFLSQLRKILILLISSYCKMCTLPTLRSRVSVCCEQYKHARSYCWQWTHFTMEPNEQNQHFAELRQKICLHIYVVVLLTCLPSLDGKLKHFVTKKWQKGLPNSSQTDYSDVAESNAYFDNTYVDSAIKMKLQIELESMRKEKSKIANIETFERKEYLTELKSEDARGKEYRIPVPRFSSYKGLHSAAGASRAYGP